MKLLLTNDDGFGAEGLRTLERLCQPLGEVVVVAPERPQSGVSHTVTTADPLRVTQRQPAAFAVSGTPADCARVAFSTLVRDADWLLAGINHGANLGSDTYISGTVAAAREAALLGLPAIALSQYVGRHRIPDWERTLRRAGPVLRELLGRGAEAGTFWNVNLPHPADEGVACEIVECPLDPSPHAVRYDRIDGHLHWRADFHQRPRLPDHDVDVCFGGRIAVTAIPLRLHPPRPAGVRGDGVPEEGVRGEDGGRRAGSRGGSPPPASLRPGR